MPEMIGGPGGEGMTVHQLKYFEHIVSTGGGINPGDSDAVIKQKLGEYNNALRRLHELGGGQGPMAYAQVPEGGYTGHYEIDPNQLDDTIKEWQDIVDGLIDDQRDINKIRNVEAPAPDQPASEMQAKALRDYGERMWQRNTEELRYAKMYLEKLGKAKHEYEQQEQHGQQMFGQQDT